MRRRRNPLGSWEWRSRSDWRPPTEGQRPEPPRDTRSVGVRGIHPTPSFSLNPRSPSCPSEYKDAPLGKKGFCGEQSHVKCLILAGNLPGAQRVPDPLLVE